MSNLTILRSYVQAADSLPAALLFKSSRRNIVIFDAFPKSIFHFLILPRLQEPILSASRLNNLQSLLSGDKETAKELIEGLAEDAKQVKKDIEDEMLNKYGFKWEVWIGFHGAPSMA
jgi:aprataxin